MTRDYMLWSLLQIIRSPFIETTDPMSSEAEKLLATLQTSAPVAAEAKAKKLIKHYYRTIHA